MTKHIVLVAVEVDVKYNAAAVRKELEYVIPFCSSELFDTLTGVYAARTACNSYQVWTSAKADGCATFEQLVAYEKATGYSYSSFVTTDDIESFVDAVGNELDGELLYHLSELA